MIVLDLFCGGGGAAMGYHQAGFKVVGVDNKPQPKYPFDFILDDALDYLANHGNEYDLIHASPPCQGYSSITKTAGTQGSHQKLIPIVRKLLKAAGNLYIIENVAGAKHELRNPLMLCGTMFGLNVIRHRYFETSPTIWFAPAMCRHHKVVVKHGRRPDRSKHFAAVTGHFSDVEFAQQSMGIDWLGQKELAQAIPPAFTQWLGMELKRMWKVNNRYE